MPLQNDRVIVIRFVAWTGTTVPWLYFYVITMKVLGLFVQPTGLK